MIKLEVQCPHCQRSLMDESHQINGAPSIGLIGKLPEKLGSQKGLICLSAFYGDYEIETTLVIPDDTIVEFSCPYCHSILSSTKFCQECKGNMVALQLKKGGMILFCSQRGCTKHFLEFEDPEADLKAFYEEYLPNQE